jgi:hypothetical protein
MYVYDVFQENWEILLCLIPQFYIEVPVPGQESQIQNSFILPGINIDKLIYMYNLIKID